MADKNPFASVGLSQFGSEGAAGGLGQDILSGLTAYAIDQSGLKDYLNSVGVSKNDKGSWTYQKPTNPIAGAAAPSGPPAPVVPSTSSVPNVPPVTFRNGSMDPNMSAQPPIAKPNDAGARLLDGDWHGSDSGQNPQETSMADASAKQFVPPMGGSQSSDLTKLASMFLMA
jgi:hypothetical protein